MGIRGVAYATLIAYLFERVALIVYVKLVLGLPVSQYTHIKKHLMWSGILLIAFVITELYLGDLLIQPFL